MKNFFEKFEGIVLQNLLESICSHTANLKLTYREKNMMNKCDLTLLLNKTHVYKTQKNIHFMYLIYYRGDQCGDACVNMFKIPRCCIASIALCMTQPTLKSLFQNPVTLQ